MKSAFEFHLRSQKSLKTFRFRSPLGAAAGTFGIIRKSAAIFTVFQVFISACPGENISPPDVPSDHLRKPGFCVSPSVSSLFFFFLYQPVRGKKTFYALNCKKNRIFFCFSLPFRKNAVTYHIISTNHSNGIGGFSCAGFCHSCCSYP